MQAIPTITRSPRRLHDRSGLPTNLPHRQNRRRCRGRCRRGVRRRGDHVPERDLREGAYMLRTNLTADSAEELWSKHMQLTEAKAAFRALKRELSIRLRGGIGRDNPARYQLQLCRRPASGLFVNACPQRRFRGRMIGCRVLRSYSISNEPACGHRGFVAVFSHPRRVLGRRSPDGRPDSRGRRAS